MIDALSKGGIRGLTVTEVKGVGMQGGERAARKMMTSCTLISTSLNRYSSFLAPSLSAGNRERYGGTEFSVTEPLDKMKIDVVVIK